MHRLVATLVACGSVFTLATPLATAQDIDRGTEERPGNLGCEAYTWDVSRELEVLAKPAISLNAGRDAKTIAHADLDKRYAVKLVPQDTVKFAAKVGKPALDDGAQAGLISFRTAKAGKYRVAITTGHWLDVVDGANLVVSRDFQGQRNCEKVQKIVEFELSGNRDFVLQLSGGTDTDVGLAITQVKPTN